MNAMDLPEITMWWSLSAGTLFLFIGLGMAIVQADRNNAVADRAKAAAEHAVATAAKTGKTPEELREQGAIGDTLESVAKLATALKDLDIATRVLVLGVALLAIGALAAGIDSIAAAAS
jgi:hypothetical protein